MISNPRGGTGFWPIAAIAAIGLNLLLASRFQAVAPRLNKAHQLLDSVTTEAKVLQSERRGLVALLHQVDLHAPPLRGSVIHESGLVDTTIDHVRLV